MFSDGVESTKGRMYSVSRCCLSAGPHQCYRFNVLFYIVGLTIALQLNIQCESKKIPLRFSEIFPQTVGNF